MPVQSVIKKFNEICKVYRNNIAVAYYNGSETRYYSFEQLDQSINVVKEHLVNCLKNGVSEENINYIGILNDPGSSFAAVVLGILDHGHPFVCFDVSSSEKRARKLIKKLGIRLIVTDDVQSKQSIAFLAGFRLLQHFTVMDEVVQIWGASNDVNVVDDRDKSDPLTFLYAIQTSGSTGESKIVQVPERCILPNIVHLREVFMIDSSDVIYYSSPVTFDPNIVELFLAVTTGATLFIIPSRLKAASHEVLNALFPKEKIGPISSVTFIQTTPSIFFSWPEEIVRERVLNDDTNLKVLALGGECFPNWGKIRKYCSKNNKTKILNLYGITEVSCWASVCCVQPNDDENDLGFPLLETILQVRNDDGNEITEGIGEMFIGSHSRYCVVGDENLSDVRLPVFRSTGDIVKVCNNKFFYVGRKDRVVKRWGQRISLSQIENVVNVCSFVKCCTCVMDANYGLVLLIVLLELDQNGANVSKIRASVRNKLNEAAVPDLVLYVDEVPLNCNGKVNYAELQLIIKKKVGNLSTNIVQSEEISNEQLKLKFYELWRKYTYAISNLESECFDNLHNTNLTSSSNEDNGFLRMGGNSLAAIQFYFELSEFIRVPNAFIGMLLRDCTLDECYRVLVNVENTTSENVSAHSKTVDVIRTENTAGNSKSLTEYDNESSKIKKKKTCSAADNVKSSKCRGKTLIFSPCTEFTFNNANGKSLKIRWQRNLKKCVDASPTVVSYESGRKIVLIGSHSGDLAVINVTDGEIISTSHLPDRIESSALISECGRYYYIGCYNKLFYCIDTYTGEKLWKFVTSDMVKSSAVYAGRSQIVIGSYDHNIYCINSETGNEIWRFKGSAGFSSVPSLTECGKIIASSLDGSCFALLPNNGTVLWSCKLSSPIFSSPAVFENSVIFAEVTGILHCYDIQTGDLKWRFSVDGNIFSSLTYCERNNNKMVIFGCHDKYVYCLSVWPSPKVLWKTSFESCIFSTPFVNNGLVAVCTTKGVINIVHLDTGDVLMSLTLSGEIFSSPVIEDDFVIVGCRDNNVYGLQICQE